MDNEKWMIFGTIVVAVIVIEWLRAQAFQKGRLSGIREATLQVSRNCSYTQVLLAFCLALQLCEPLHILS